MSETVEPLGKENREPNGYIYQRSGKAERTPVKHSGVHSASCLAELQEELTCSICLEICVLPSTTACGHSFCRRCLKRALAADLERRCPKCRVQLPDQPLAVHSVLWNVIQMLFPSQAREAVKNQAPATPLPANPFVRRHARGASGARARPESIPWRNSGPSVHPPSYRVDVEEAPSFRIDVEDDAVVVDDPSDVEWDHEAAESAFWEAAGLSPPEGMFLGASRQQAAHRPSGSGDNVSLWERIVAAEASDPSSLLDGMSALGLTGGRRSARSGASSPVLGRTGAIRLEPNRHRAEERARWRSNGRSVQRSQRSSSFSSRTALDDVLGEIPRAGSRPPQPSTASSPGQQRPISRHGSRGQNMFMRQPSQQRRQAAQPPLSHANSGAPLDSSGAEVRERLAQSAE